MEAFAKIHNKWIEEAELRVHRAEQSIEINDAPAKRRELKAARCALTKLRNKIAKN